ncbi:hypothetical protein AVEN_143541-1 [Araneus ventricosus]|uniref:RNA-directed DNA polymerase from transposon X-element n=1 Tax=Araneus ventricosus TaxID=182803 RepID=A0A4Y2AN95_ARAVE|nr:hypothetical protein AVEN_143541-1 [Araneus ventricosus]
MKDFLLKTSIEEVSSPCDKNLYNRAHSHLRKLHQQANEKRKAEKIASLSPEDSSVWKQARWCTGDKFHMPPHYNHKNGFHPSGKSRSKRRLSKFFKRHPIDKIEPCKPSEIVRIIGKLKKGKSPGIDGFTNLMLQRLPIKSIFRLVEIINAILKFHHFPKAWKTAIVVPIIKPGKNAQDPVSYRPISFSLR